MLKLDSTFVNVGWAKRGISAHSMAFGRKRLGRSRRKNRRATPTIALPSSAAWIVTALRASQ
jgi:hypothetical protein